jgi:pyruvate dehydrogenase E1 component alpha subunit
LAAGVAFKIKYLKEPSVCLGYMGEGATNIGGFHEALSLAALWKLPAVFIVENNEYSMGTPLERTLPVRDITLKASGYGMYSDRFQAADVFEVRERLKKAIEHARSGQGPALVEILTYRFRGHSMSDPGKYRTPEEVELRKQKDCVRVARKELLDNGVPAPEVDAIDASVEEEVRDAVAFADGSPTLSEAEMHGLVYAKSRDSALADPDAPHAVQSNLVGG